jgi:hypothetical protein
MNYKGRSGYRLKKGASGELRWHKEEAKQPLLPDKQLRTKSGDVIYRQPSFKITKEDLNLDTHPDQFYNSRERLVLPTLDYNGNRDHSAPDTIFHGTRYEFKDFDSSAFGRPKTTGHWNNVLGSHFSTSRDVAQFFADGTIVGNGIDRRAVFNRIPDGESGRVIEVAVGIKNPIMIAHEADFDAYAAAYILLGDDISDDELDASAHAFGRSTVRDIKSIRSNPKDGQLQKLKSMMRNISGDLSPETIFKELYVDADQKGGTDADGKVRHAAWYAAMLKSGDKFKGFLEDLGYDGMIYRNFMEGGIGVTPFDNKQITIIGEDRTGTKLHRPTSRTLYEQGARGKHSADHKEYNQQIELLQDELMAAKDSYSLTASIKTGEEVGSRFEGIDKARRMWRKIYTGDKTDGIYKQIVTAHLKKYGGKE